MVEEPPEALLGYMLDASVLLWLFGSLPTFPAAVGTVPRRDVVHCSGRPAPPRSNDGGFGVKSKRRVPSLAFYTARTLLGAPSIATRSKDATRGSWHRY